MTILDKLREVHRLRGDTFSSYEVIGLIGHAAAEIERLEQELSENERLRAAIKEMLVAFSMENIGLESSKRP